jgi:trimeric autotransporter adhesin
MAALGSLAWGQNSAPTNASAASAPASCEITGKVTTGSIPLPGVSITASNSLTGKKSVGSTELDGTYVLEVGPKGRYVIRAEFAAFATATSEVVVNAENCHPKINVAMTLLSRVQRAPATQAGGDDEDDSQAVSGQGNAVASQRGFQNLGLSMDASGATGLSQNGGSSDTSAQGMPSASFVNEGATESVAVAGSGAQSNESMFTSMGGPGDFNGPGGQGGPGGPGGFGGPGGGGYGGGRGGPGVFMLGGRRGRFNFNQPHGSIFYSLDDSAFDAKPFSLTGQPTPKPSYAQNRFGATIGGPLNIPHLYHGGTKTFYFINYTGNLSQNPYNAYSTVPTQDERNGIFTGLTQDGTPIQLIDPATGQPFLNNIIPAGMITSSAKELLNYIPLPNLSGTSQNYHYVTSLTNENQNLNVRLVHNFGSSGSGGFGGMGGGRRGGGNNISIGFHYQDSTVDLANAFPTLTGATHITGWDIPIGWTKSKGHLTSSVHFDFNRSFSKTNNAYAYVTNVAGLAGITGVSENPFDWGVPALSFTNYSGAQDITPSRQVSETITIGDNLIYTHGKHAIRFGGEYRRLHIDPETDSNARGNFIFTGLYSGYDFSDFLLGLSQSASAQYGDTSYHFRGNVFDGYVQDDWRVRSNFTLNLGLRYEYFGPLYELNNQIVNLDIAPGYTAVAPVLPGQVGPYTGAFPRSLVNGDPLNFAPRVGIAWKAMKDTVVRAGYGINYNTSAYNNIALQMAYQPPFAFTETNTGEAGSPLVITNAFANAPPSTVTNNYAVDKNYRMGYVQIWNLDIQRVFKRDLVINVSYTGTKGTHLDMLQDPNRTATGLLIPGVQPFTLETSVADSILNAGTLRVRKRMSHGVSLGGTFVYAKSIDNASSIGGAGTGVVAQDAQDLAAERGLSSFNRKFVWTGDFNFELPWGMNKKWLNTKSTANWIFGDWSLTGSYTLETGTPFTPRIVGSYADVSRGSNGSLRADTTGLPVVISNPTIGEWFNTAAFVAPPEGQYGDAGRNSVIGPGQVVVNVALAKDFNFGETRNFEVRWQANNVLNTPPFTTIDTTVTSPTFGRVIGVGSMRTMQLVARYRF